MLAIGTSVRFTAGRLGLVREAHAIRFEPEVVERGDTGVYEGVHPTLEVWHLVRVGELLCPCHESQFEPVP